MKIRKGFVSNSSTTSFCIYGVSCDSSHKNEEPSLSDKKDIDRFLHEKGLFVTSHPENDDDCYIGLEINKIKDEETFREFKDRTKKLMKEIYSSDFFQDDENYQIITEGWYA
ncbi:hypothetical protein M0R19_03960 [Candidatus Pacearchaeota archaeon]|jgi:hypothetical protein|nr:hypothetical protein [Candidatus Pacearchaeota archaeon]